MNPRICLLCGQEYTPIHGMQKVCRSCRDRYRNSRRNAKKDARIVGGDTSISLMRLWIRDGPTCALCGRVMSLDSAPNSNEHPSIDHIIPLIRGGAHEWDNIRLVCRGCNESKGCRMPQEAEA